MTQKQIEATRAIEKVHREQEESHCLTVERHEEVMELIEKAGEGLNCNTKECGASKS